MTDLLRVPCSYQGGKQRVASQVVDAILAAAPGPNSEFYDLCCGSGAISIELVNRGVDPAKIVMLDISSWGVFWSAIGSDEFDVTAFDLFLSEIPAEKRDIRRHLQLLATKEVGKQEAEIYPILQAGSFGGKQIWRNGNRWENAFFRDYWEPTPTSVRRSPANPLQPSPGELGRRVRSIQKRMKGVRCVVDNITSILDASIPNDAVVYVDPPYQGTTGYAFDFDLASFVSAFREQFAAGLFVSEGVALTPDAKMLNFGGANGGISGNRVSKHQEWLSRY